MENRIAFKMKLKEGCEAEYEARHKALWPEIKALLKKQGVYDYSIYHDKETNILFAFQKIKGTESSQSFSEQDDKEIIYKWWNYMADIMEVNEDKSPVTIYLDEVFHLD